MSRSLDEMRSRALPGPWLDALEALSRAQADHAALWKATRDDHERFYDTPEPMRGMLEKEAASVDRIHASMAAVAEARDALPAAREREMIAEAERLGRIRGDAPAWVRLLRDLQSLRTWRAAHLDGVDVHLAPLLRDGPVRTRRGSLLDRVLVAWGKAAGLKVEDARQRAYAFAQAGLMPGMIDYGPVVTADSFEPCGDRLAEFASREGLDVIAREIAAAAEELPADVYPVPREALEALGLPVPDAGAGGPPR